MREGLEHWPFVNGAYLVGIICIVLLVAWCWWDMRRAEKRREETRRK